MQKKLKVCHITTGLNNSLFLEAIWKYLDHSKYSQTFVFLNDKQSSLEEKMRHDGAQTKLINFVSSRDIPRATLELIRFFREVKPDIVHTHLVYSGLVGLTAAFLTRAPYRVSTRHHGSENHLYQKKGIAYDRYINIMSRKVAAITKTVSNILVQKEKLDPNKVEVINYGYDFTDFETNNEDIAELRLKYDLDNKSPIVGVISRFVELKGVQYIIPAFKMLLKKFPDAVLVLANASGNYSSEIQRLIHCNLEPDRYRIIEFEQKVFALYGIFDIFVHVPIDREVEAFGQTYVESLYQKVPSVFTLSGIANDFIENEVNAVVVPYKDSEAIYDAMIRLLSNKDLCSQITRRGYLDVISRFGGESLGVKLDQFYESLK